MIDSTDGPEILLQQMTITGEGGRGRGGGVGGGGGGGYTAMNFRVRGMGSQGML